MKINKGKYKKNNVNDESIAIIGMSCRFAHGTNNPDLLWKALKENKDLSELIPKFVGT